MEDAIPDCLSTNRRTKRSRRKTWKILAYVYMPRTAKLFLRLVVTILLQLVVVAHSVSAQTAATDHVPTMAFDVASIHEDPPSDNYVSYGSITPNTGSFFGNSLTFIELLLDAYPIRMDQIVGETLGHSRFTVRASVDEVVNAKFAAFPARE